MTLLIFILAGGTAAQAAAVRIVPEPKEMELLPAPISIHAGNTAIIIGEKAAPPEQYAAEILRESMRKRFGLKLQIHPESADLSAYKVLIILGQRTTNKMIDRIIGPLLDDPEAAPPAQDGYVIRVIEGGGRTMVFVAGGNARGVIYGQDTLFQLMEKQTIRGTFIVHPPEGKPRDVFLHREDSSVILRRAWIRDWPSIPWRGKPQTQIARHLEPGAIEWYARARFNFADLRNGTYAFEPDDELPAEEITRALDECHRAGLMVYGTVNCGGASRPKHDRIIEQFQRFIELGVDGLWVSFDDKGPAEESAELMRRILELGRMHGMTAERIAITPPKGSYQVIDTRFNREIASIPGMENAMWFFTCIPSMENLKAAKAIGLKVPPAWWHNWPRATGGPNVTRKVFSYGFLYGGYSRKDGKPAYLPIPALAEGWHEPSYEQLSDAGATTRAVMQWGGSAWKWEYTYPVMGWWAWRPEKHDFSAVQARIYDLVFGREQSRYAKAYDDAYRELRKLFVISASQNICDARYPIRLMNPNLRQKALRLIRQMENALLGVRLAKPEESFTTSERLQSGFLEPMSAEIHTARAAAELEYPEYWWDSHQRAVLSAFHKGDEEKAAKLIQNVRERLLDNIEQIKVRLSDLSGLEGYTKWWIDRANLDVDGWKALLETRKKEHSRRLTDFEFRKTGRFASTLLKGLRSPPQGKVVASAMPGGELYRGCWTGGVFEKDGLKAYAFTYPLKTWAHIGDYDEVSVVLPLPAKTAGCGIRFFLSARVNDTIAFEEMKERWTGRRFLTVSSGEKILWKTDVASDLERGQWIRVPLSPAKQGEKKIEVRFRVEDIEESYNYAAAIFIGPVQIVR